MTLFSVTLRAGLVTGSPSIITRPSTIMRSASRREQTPARAMAFAMRSPSGLFSDKRLSDMTDDEAIALALAEAQSCATRGEVPVGAVLLAPDGGLLAQDGNRILERRDPTAHAE